VLGVGAAKLLGGAGRAMGRVKGRLEGAQGKAAASRKTQELIDEGIPVKPDPGAIPSTQDEMVAAIKKLEPREPAVVEFIRRTKSKRTAQQKGDLRTMSFQGIPDENAAVREWSRVSAAKFGDLPNYSHLTKEQVGELFYRKRVHGLAERSFEEFLSLTKGMPKNEIDAVLRSLSRGFPYKPAEKGLFGPVVDREAARRMATTNIPLDEQIDFWRMIPLEGLRKLTLPDGKILQLTTDQARAASHIIADIAVHGIPWRKKVGGMLTKLAKALKTPRRMLYSLFRAQGVGLTRRYLLAGAGFQIGGIGKAFAGAEGLSILGSGAKGMAKIFLADSTGEALRTVGREAGISLSGKIGQVLGFLDRPGLYRLGVYQLLKDPEFVEAAQGMIGAPGE